MIVGWPEMCDERLLYDRKLLLLGSKRDAVLELWEVQRYGIDSFGDIDYVSIFGMRPIDWFARGVRLLGRTVVECTRDQLADAIGRDVAATIATQPRLTGVLAVDLFAGSANTLYWLLRHLPGSRGIGFESNDGVFRLTRSNIGALELSLEVLNTDWVAGLSGVAAVPDEMLVLFIAPPWGNALDTASGLDLNHTIPPVIEIVDYLLHRFSTNRLICAIQVFEILVSASVTDLRTRFDWSSLRLYELNSPGQNHGPFLGTKGWTPSVGST
jgi:hypothetical protein